MLTAEDYREMARDDIVAAERFAREGNISRTKEFQLSAALGFLRFAVRRECGAEELAQTAALQCIQQASALAADAHPTYLLDAAHIAILFGATEIACAWLKQARSKAAVWSAFWARYATDLGDMIEGHPTSDAPIPFEHPEQVVWAPYVDLMQVLSRGEDSASAYAAIRESFVHRQQSRDDPGLLDGRPGDPILWDWRCATIQTAAARLGQRK